MELKSYPNWEEIKHFSLRQIKDHMRPALAEVADILESNPKTQAPVARIREAVSALGEPFTKEEFLRLAPLFFATKDLGDPRDERALRHSVTASQWNSPVWRMLSDLYLAFTNMNHDNDTFE